MDGRYGVCDCRFLYVCMVGTLYVGGSGALYLLQLPYCARSIISSAISIARHDKVNVHHGVPWNADSLQRRNSLSICPKTTSHRRYKTPPKRSKSRAHTPSSRSPSRHRIARGTSSTKHGQRRPRLAPRDIFTAASRGNIQNQTLGGSSPSQF